MMSSCVAEVLSWRSLWWHHQAAAAWATCTPLSTSTVFFTVVCYESKDSAVVSLLEDADGTAMGCEVVVGGGGGGESGRRC